MSKIPKTDSIEDLAKFWDSHDLTEFEDDIEEVPACDSFGSEKIASRSLLQKTKARHSLSFR
jgi:hypothetical protein